jgi:hypothetical protein
MQTKITFLAILCSVFSFGQVGTIFITSGINYKITAATTVEVSFNQNTLAGVITIPETVSYNNANYQVTSISGYAFANCTGLTSVTIPNSIISIDRGAFYECSNLTSIAIPNSVTNIGSYAFHGCSSLTAVTIPNSVTSIGEMTFYSCTSLTAVAIPNSVTSIGSSAFYSCSGLTAVSIPNSVTSIGYGAFAICSGLTAVNIPSSVTSIADNTFYYCTGLTSVTIPNTVMSIGKSAFYNCTGLTVVEIPNSVTFIGDNAFFSCNKLPSVIIPNSITSISDSTFENCKSLISITIPNSVTTIGEGAFRFCSGLTSITIPNSVISIGMSAFSSCNSLTSVTLPNLITSLAQAVFTSCSGLTSISIPNSVTSIGDSAFESCRSLTSFVIPVSVTSIGKRAFRTCNGLTSIAIPNSVTSIDDMAFADCVGLAVVTVNATTPISINRNVFDNLNLYDLSLNVPLGTESVYKAALVWKDFYSIAESGSGMVQAGQTFTVDGINYYVRKATLPYEVGVSNTTTFVGAATIPSMVSYSGNSFAVTSIGNSGFKNCIGLTSVTIPTTIASIGTAAFSGCTGLTMVTIPTSVTSIGNSSFRLCRSLTSITIPNSVSSIGSSAFASCNGLTAVTIPNSVTSIGIYSFSGCSKLTSVTVEWTNFLSITRDVFNALDLSSRTLNVPLGTASAYKAADVWKEFGTIVEAVAPLVGQKIAANGINYVVTKATLPYEVAVATDNQGSSGRYTNAVQTGISGAVIIPATVSIEGNSFSVTGISAFAFQNSTGLTSITIPSSVTNIGDFAFSNCSGLTAVTVNWNAPLAINRNVFENITLAPITLNVAADTEMAYTEANVWKEFKIVTLGTNHFSVNTPVNFHPNPTKSQINFSQEINTLEVFDIAGKKIKSFHNPNTSYDVTTLQKGVYIIKGATADGKSINEKLVKE